jgi:hypothetical protein
LASAQGARDKGDVPSAKRGTTATDGLKPFENGVEEASHGGNFPVLQPEFQRLLQSEDAEEARAAVQQGRPPVFQGH